MEIDALYHHFRISSGVCTDTRSDLQNKLFFCLKGPNFDANQFAKQALAKGASHVVSDDQRYKGEHGISVVDDALTALQCLAHHHRQQLNCPVIGLTGSNGKTTHKELIAVVLAKKYRTQFTFGNLNNHIGVPLTLLSMPLDTEMAVVEMGANHQGEIKVLSSICTPNFGMITNIGKAHLEGFGGLEGVRKGKGELFDKLRMEANHLVFLNGDDPVLCDMALELNTLRYGTSEAHFICGIQGTNSETVIFQYREGSYTSEAIQSNLAGDYNFVNLLAAVCVGRYFDVPHADVKAALEAYTPTINRSQLQQTEFNTLLMDAYNANPSSMKPALENFARMQRPNKLVILGHMLELGADAQAEHEAVIALVRALGLKTVLVGAHYGPCEKTGLLWFEKTEELLEWLKRRPIKDTTILLKGSRMVALEKAKDYL
jgi:UDP-N-acetylmuramoyl-tripeptide--D-alanyl-D-alanine ligase